MGLHELGLGRENWKFWLEITYGGNWIKSKLLYVMVTLKLC